jgi:hypothetical protein
VIDSASHSWLNDRPATVSADAPLCPHNKPSFSLQTTLFGCQPLRMMSCKSFVPLTHNPRSQTNTCRSRIAHDVMPSAQPACSISYTGEKPYNRLVLEQVGLPHSTQAMRFVSRRAALNPVTKHGQHEPIAPSYLESCRCIRHGQTCLTFNSSRTHSNPTYPTDRIGAQAKPVGRCLGFV